MSNIGHVQYKKNENGDALTAVWAHDDYGYGTGKATGILNTSFEGNYQIKYFDNDGSLQAELALEIKKEAHCYNLIWRKNNKITSRGIGMENSGVLSAGYYDV
jgi:hypothetical protein